jgi:hypothetical protein
MARRPNSVVTVTITISTTERVQQHLEDLVSGGLFGKNPAEAAERLVARGLENLLREGTLNRGKTGGSRRGGGR